MAKGILGVITCPKLEDELIYGISNDPEDKKVIVIDSPYDRNLMRKLEKRGIPFEKMDKGDFMDADNKIDRDEFTIAVLVNDPGLHMEPKELRATVQEQLVTLQGHVDAVGLYYGTCGNLGWDISKWAEDNLSYPVTAIRDREGHVINNCIGVAVGGSEGYRNLVKKYGSSMFITPANAAEWEDAASEADKGEASKESMKKMLRVAGYKHAVQIDTGLVDRDEFDKAINKYAESMELEIIQAEPGITDIWPTDNMYKESKAKLE